MGEEDEREPKFPKLSFLHMRPLSATVESPEHQPGTSTPPLQSLASVPFKWEEQPGKPRPCTDLIPVPEPEPAKILELPPCRTASLYTDNSPASRITRTPSPTTVLDGPYNVGRPKFSSFRFFREAHNEYSFENSTGCPHEDSLFLGTKTKRGKGLFGKFKGGKKIFDGGSTSSRFSPSSISSCENDESCSRVKNNNGGGNIRRNGSFSNVSHAKSSHIWGSIYEGLKQVMQWKSSKKSKKEGQD